ncbi:monoamine oxidase [Quadrisphaera granulorum]|uniref:Monoamine oxidase n=1 Tax=Quadrisphaera granulorum TaxID=317664 RepID=A0A316A8L0_9ACTN|nr:flavin monoamine oxidase family protein [Quadrisphaera granulorum]PWJ53852.1 monoamine oxidase [Quadrisphaera granulorum]SZE96609.1 monoamine oxidase [Quadrisphaera granulorum]
MSTPPLVDVVVVGAGLSGLTAARRATQLGLTTRVYEAADRVGGRVWSTTVAGVHVDLGGTFVGPGQDRIVALAAEVGVSLYDTYDTGANVVRWRSQVKRYRGTVPPLGAALLDVARIQATIERAARQVPCGRPQDAPGAAALDAQTLGGWLRQQHASRTARDLFDLVSRTTWGCDADHVSLLHVLHYIHLCGGLSSMLDTAGGAQESHFVQGSHEVAVRVAEQLGDAVRTDEPVTRIDWDDDGALVHTDRGSCRARRVVLAVAPTMRRKIRFNPELPAAHEQMAQRWPGGVLSKAYAVYETPFWREQGLSGQGLSDRGPVFITFDASPHQSREGVLLGFVGGPQGRAWDELPEAERRVRALASFADLYGPKALEPIGYIDQKWGADPWTGGGPCAAPSAGAVVPYYSHLATPVGPLHWAGTETADRWSGFMDGAVRAGERAAVEVLRSISTQADSTQADPTTEGAPA